jgi:hypothetical protein
VDQDVGLSTPVRYFIQGDILSFLVLNAKTADITTTRSLENHELFSSTILIIKVCIIIVWKFPDRQNKILRIINIFLIGCTNQQSRPLCSSNYNSF